MASLAGSGWPYYHQSAETPARKSKRSLEESDDDDEQSSKRGKHNRTSEFTGPDDVPLFVGETAEGQDPESPDSAVGISPPQPKVSDLVGVWDNRASGKTAASPSPSSSSSPLSSPSSLPPSASASPRLRPRAQVGGRFKAQLEASLAKDGVHSSPSPQDEATIPHGPLRIVDGTPGAVSDWDLPLTGCLKLTALEIATFLPNLYQNPAITHRLVTNHLSPGLFRLMVLEHRSNRRTAETDDWNAIVQNDKQFCNFEALGQGFREVMSKGPEPGKAAPAGWDPLSTIPVGYQEAREAHNGADEDAPDVPFTELLRGVTRIPTGADAADLTRALTWAAAAKLRSGKVYMFPSDLPEVLALVGRAKYSEAQSDKAVADRFRKHYAEVIELTVESNSTTKKLWPGFEPREKTSCYDMPRERRWNVEHDEILQEAANLLPSEMKPLFYKLYKPNPRLHVDTQHLLNKGLPNSYSDFISDTPISGHDDDGDFLNVVSIARQCTKEGTPTGAPTKHRWSYGDYDTLLADVQKAHRGQKTPQRAPPKTPQRAPQKTPQRAPAKAETAHDDEGGSTTEEDDTMTRQFEEQELEKVKKEKEKKQKEKEQQRLKYEKWTRQKAQYVRAANTRVSKPRTKPSPAKWGLPSPRKQKAAVSSFADDSAATKMWQTKRKQLEDMLKSCGGRSRLPENGPVWLSPF